MIIRVIPEGDLALDDDGNFIWATGPEYIRQRIAQRLQFFLGEYFLDLRQGIPYYRHAFVKNPNLDVLRQLYRSAILSTPGVLVLNSLDLAYDQTVRQLTVAFHATVDDGEVVIDPDDDAFIISLDDA